MTSKVRKRRGDDATPKRIGKIIFRFLARPILNHAPINSTKESGWTSTIVAVAPKPKSFRCIGRCRPMPVVEIGQRERLLQTIEVFRVTSARLAGPADKADDRRSELALQKQSCSSSDRVEQAADMAAA